MQQRRPRRHPCVGCTIADQLCSAARAAEQGCCVTLQVGLKNGGAGIGSQRWLGPPPANGFVTSKQRAMLS